MGLSGESDFMKNSDFYVSISSYFRHTIGVRPDIALLFILFFLIALAWCIRLSKKYQLFNFSNNVLQENLNDWELLK